MAVRKIIRIDEEKCDGCGQCVTACAEGAIRIVDGKARLVSETYCDGLGNCLGTCPQDAIRVEEREAAEFDASAVQAHVRDQRPAEVRQKPARDPRRSLHGGACPGARAFSFHRRAPASAQTDEIPSQLINWPVKLVLAPVTAPHYHGSTLVIAADCVPFAYADFHRRFLAGKPLVTACPKFGDAGMLGEKLARIFRENDVAAVEVLHMEVPCCTGLVRLTKQALDDAGRNIPVRLTKIGLRGEVLQSEDAPSATEVAGK